MKGNARYLVLMVLAGLAMAALVLGPGTDTPLAAETGDGPAARRGTDPKVEAAGATGEPGDAEPTRKKMDAPEAPPEKAPAGEEPQGPLPPAQDGWPVLVVDRQTDKPVAGARLFVADRCRHPDPKAFSLALQSARQDLEPFLDAFADEYVTDDKGRTAIPAPGGLGGLVVARKDNRWAVLTMDRGLTPPLRLELDASKVLQARVRNGKGKPVAGIPVAIFRKQGSRFYFQVKATTDEKGLATFRNLTWLADAGGDEVTYEVGLHLPHRNPRRHKVKLDKPPARPIELVMPETGSLEVRAMTPSGKPFLAKGRVALTCYDGRGKVVGNYWTLHQRARPLVDGKVLFPHVGVGTRLRIFAYRDSSSWWSPIREDVVGPMAAGQKATHTFRYRAESPAILVKVIDEKKTPLADTNLKWTFSMDHPRWGRDTMNREVVRSDSQGVIRIPCTWNNYNWRGYDKVVTVSTMGLDGKPVAAARIPTLRDFPPGETRIDDLELTAARTLASGKVVDGAGKPVMGALITPYRQYRYGGSLQHFWWSRIYGLQATTDAKGRFSLVGTLHYDALYLEAKKKGFNESERQEVGIGATNVTLRLSTAGEVAGRVLLDKGIKPTLLRATAHYIDPAGKSRTAKAKIDRAGRFRWTTIPPGMVDVTVHSNQGGVEFTRIAGIHIVAGKANTDPRLQEVDLRGAVFPIKVKVVSGTGQPISWASIRYGPRYRHRHYLRSGKATILYNQPMVDMKLSVYGHRPAEFSGVTDDQTLVLEPQFPVRLAFKTRLPQDYTYRYMRFYVEWKLVATERYIHKAHIGYKTTTSMYYYKGRSGYSTRTMLNYPGTYEATMTVRYMSKGRWVTRPVKGFKRELVVEEDPRASTGVSFELKQAELAELVKPKKPQARPTPR